MKKCGQEIVEFMLMELSKLRCRKSLLAVPGVLGINDASAQQHSQTQSKLILFVLRLNIPVNNFSVMSGQANAT